ncbi:hypothetical protein C8R45DRAFT_1039080 [Mycena sanguinolenta]|nr:hypothetical protein C8R45DRAFT_1039080 [Mycena sanguinolenta]
MNIRTVPLPAPEIRIQPVHRRLRACVSLRPCPSHFFRRLEFKYPHAERFINARALTSMSMASPAARASKDGWVAVEGPGLRGDDRAGREDLDHILTSGTNARRWDDGVCSPFPALEIRTQARTVLSSTTASRSPLTANSRIRTTSVSSIPRAASISIARLRILSDFRCAAAPNPSATLGLVQEGNMHAPTLRLDSAVRARGVRSGSPSSIHAPADFVPAGGSDRWQAGIALVLWSAGRVHTQGWRTE